MMWYFVIAGSDFEGGSSSQTFPASGPLGNQLCADIFLIPDERYEGNEQFIVEFINVPDSANRVGVGAINQTCVTIIDDDGKFVIFQVECSYN